MSHWIRPSVVVLALLLAGCGSSNSTSNATKATAATTASTSTPARAGSPAAALIAQADPICKQVSAQRAVVNSELKSATTSQALLAALARTAPSIAALETRAVAQLRALNVPASLSKDWQTMLAGLQQLASNTAQLGLAAKSNNSKKGEQLTASSQQIQRRLVALGLKDGFTYCGRTS